MLLGYSRSGVLSRLEARGAMRDARCAVLSALSHPKLEEKSPSRLRVPARARALGKAQHTVAVDRPRSTCFGSRGGKLSSRSAEEVKRPVEADGLRKIR